MSDSKADTQTGEDLAGKILRGEYRIERQLGSGGMSHVYLAHQISVDRPVVVKVMIPPSVDVDRWKGRFMREARAASKIRHRGVVTIYSFGEEEGVGPFIAMEYVTGRSLREVIHAEAPIEPERAANIVAQACRALHAAHEQGVVHRDLKPDNLMVDIEDGQEQTRVLDFGVAKAPDALVDTLDGHVVGTPAYMAPEQARNQEVDARADVYSMGIILFELLTGQRPFEAPTAVAMMLKHVQEPLPIERVGKLDPALIAALEQACTKSVDERWPSAAAFADALEQLAPPVAVSTPTELGAIESEDLVGAPKTPEPVPTFEHAPGASVKELADVTAGDLTVHEDSGARLAMGISLGALVIAVLAVAGFVGIIVSGDEPDEPSEPARDSVVIEVLDAGGLRPQESSQVDDGLAIAVGRAASGIAEARALAAGYVRAQDSGNAVEKPTPSRKGNDDFEFEMVKDPTKDKGKIIEPSFGE